MLNYGGRREIIDAIKTYVKNGGDIDSLTEDNLQPCLYTEGILDPDILLRTGGDLRISNFMLWQAAYSEFFWTFFGQSSILRNWSRLLVSLTQRSSVWRFKRMKRIITGLVLITFGGYVLINGALPLMLFLMLIGSLAFYEIRSITDLKSNVTMIANIIYLVTMAYIYLFDVQFNKPYVIDKFYGYLFA